jgi:hypothetical protein
MAHHDILPEVRALVVLHACAQQVVPRRAFQVVLARARLDGGDDTGDVVGLADVHLVRGVGVPDEPGRDLGDRVVLVGDVDEGLAELLYIRSDQIVFMQIQVSKVKEPTCSSNKSAYA